MATDISQQSLKEPAQVDWETAFKSSKYEVPPPALGPDGKPITYYGVSSDIKETDADQGYLNFVIDLALTRAGSFDGRRVRTWASTRPFQKRAEDGTLVPVKGNPNALAKFLRAAGLQAKPQTNSEYRATVRAVNGKAIGFTIDWEARNKDTGETVRGYNAFPDDPERPGQKKAILKAGDIYNELDSKGNIIGQKQVQSEILFANARLKYFQDATKTSR
jgi:hypothetical protein